MQISEILKSPTFCIFPWIHLDLNPNGTLKLCCRAHEAITTDDGQPISVYQQSLTTIWNTPYLRTIRQAMCSGQAVPACRNCYAVEKHGEKSRRQHVNKRWLNEVTLITLLKSLESDFSVATLPIFFQVNPGNLCNLKCRMCSATFSSKIEADPIHHAWAPPIAYLGNKPIPASATDRDDRHYLKSRFVGPQPWFRQSSFIFQELLSQPHRLRKLYFTGGEPFFNPCVHEILSYLIKEHWAPAIELQFNSNCTILPKDLLQKLACFRKVEIGLSIDAAYAHYNYMRFPAHWEEVDKNLQVLKTLANYHIYAVPIIQIYNVLYLPELLGYLDSYAIRCLPHFLTTPSHLRIENLPEPILKAAAERVLNSAHRLTVNQTAAKSLAEHLAKTTSHYTPDRFAEFWEFTCDLDASRGQDFCATFPLLTKMLKASRINLDKRYRYYHP